MRIRKKWMLFLVNFCPLLSLRRCPAREPRDEASTVAPVPRRTGEKLPFSAEI
jgi:hypothetical protein